MKRFFYPWYKRAEMRHRRGPCAPKCMYHKQEIVDGQAVTVRVFSPRSTAVRNDTINHMTGRKKKAWKPTFIPD